MNDEFAEAIKTEIEKGMVEYVALRDKAHDLELKLRRVRAEIDLLRSLIKHHEEKDD